MPPRSRPIHVSTILAIVLACMALAAPAAAQHCWPSSVALLVRDEQGALIHPRELAEYVHIPQGADTTDMRSAVQRLQGSGTGGLAPSGTRALVWYGRGDCRVFLDEVALTRGAQVMRLRLNVRLDTQADPGPAEYVIDTPAFQAGTWELVPPLPPGRGKGAAGVTADRWRRLPDRRD